MTSRKGSRFTNFEILTSVFSPKKTYPYQIWDQNNHFIEFYCGLCEFWAILVKIEVSEVTKGVKIYKFRNSDIIIGFLPSKNIPMPNLGSKQSFYRVLLWFTWILGWFWWFSWYPFTDNFQMRHAGPMFDIFWKFQRDCA